MMKRSRPFVHALVAVAVLVVAAGPVGAREDETGRVSLETLSVAAGFGYTWGEGVLEFRGQKYPFKVTGLSMGDIGVSKTAAAGEVHNLKNPEEFEGLFMAVVASASLAAGAGAAALQNQKDVQIVWTSTNQGLSFSLAPTGFNVEFTEAARQAAQSHRSPAQGDAAAAPRPSR